MNLFEISNDFRAIIAELEETGGELTPEIEEKLSITESNLKDKLNSYVNTIKTIKTDIESCALEVKRINAYKKSKESLLNKLESNVCQAIEEFGDKTKSGGSYYDLGTAKLSVRKSKSCELDEDLIEKISNEFYIFLMNIKHNNLLGTGSSFVDDFIKYLKDTYDIGTDDLSNLNFTVTVEGNVLDALNGKHSEILNSGFDETEFKLNCSASKSKCKESIENNKVLSFARVKDNKSLTIK